MGTGVSGKDDVDVNWDLRLPDSGAGAITELAFSSLSAPGRYAYRKFSLLTDGKNGVSPVFNFAVTLVKFTVYVCPFSAATLRERR